ncbi:MAG: DUF3025 domain-containing protein [Burkholderiales bacterium]
MCRASLDWITRSPLFAPLREVASGLPHVGWPDTEVLNALADGCGRRIVNANGQLIRFVVQDAKPVHFEEMFEPRAFLRGEVLVRRFNWHDLFNALVWMTFPTAKASLNARNYAALCAHNAGQRSPEGDALTLFDEDGVVALSSDRELVDLLREFRWKPLFWEQREAVRSRMRFLAFGHSLFEKALKPYVGMTGKAIVFEVSETITSLEHRALLAEVDRLSALYIWDREHLSCGRTLAPLPVLGIPGWWKDNEDEGFYDNADYFRPGRSRAPRQPPTSSIA